MKPRICLFFFLGTALLIGNAPSLSASGLDFVVSIQTVSLASVGENVLPVTAKNGQSRVSNRATIRNSGSADEDFLIRIASTSGIWIPVSGVPGPNQYRLSAIWHQWDVQPAPSEFQANDVLTMENQASSNATFFNDSDTHSVAGTQAFGVPPLAESALYFMFEAPSEGTGSAVAHVNVTAIASLSAARVLISTGGAIGAGTVSFTIPAGMSVRNRILPDGRFEETFISSIAAAAAYSNGFWVGLPPGALVTVISSTDGAQVTSTQPMSMGGGGIGINSGPGTLSASQSFDHFFVNFFANSMQNLFLSVPGFYAKPIDVTLDFPSGVITLLMPSGSFSEDVVLSISPSGISPFPTLGKVSGSPAFATSLNMGLEITLNKNIRPLKPAGILFNYRELDLTDVDRTTLRIGRLDEESRLWINLPTDVDDQAKTASAFTNHFSRFQLLAFGPASDVTGANAFPNPLRTHMGQTEMTFANLSTDAEIKIYTFLGELVRVLNSDSTGTARWDAKNSFGETVASGIYLVTIGDVMGSRKIMKVAVEK